MKRVISIGLLSFAFMFSGCDIDDGKRSVDLGPVSAPDQSACVPGPKSSGVIVQDGADSSLQPFAAWVVWLVCGITTNLATVIICLGHRAKPLSPRKLWRAICKDQGIDPIRLQMALHPPAEKTRPPYAVSNIVSE